MLLAVFIYGEKERKMSVKGIKKFAEHLTNLQLLRHELICMGVKKLGREGQADIYFGQLLMRMEDEIKADFVRIIDGRMPTGERQYG